MSGDAFSPAPTRVGIGIVRRGRHFLVRQRVAPSPLAGCWEFAGGKCEPGESPADAARRECREECGLEVALLALRSVTRHRYPHGDVLLHFFDGEPRPLDAEPDAASGFVWVDLARLVLLEFPEANAPLIADLAREFGQDRPEHVAEPAT